ncbi:uncharacterized Rho GTPase-activating protein At5g61530 isoform X1 [Nymphaea colorata]|nr:uncharacterized Rho GTPase-activating protein At5g61530 isoform X1 [Nymphaea colorata]
MSLNSSSQWQERANNFFSSSGTKLKKAGQSAGTVVGEVAKDAGENVADVAERFGSFVKRRWSILQQNRQQQASNGSIHERLSSAANSTSTLLKRSISETKEKVTIGKVKVEEAARRTTNRSRSLLSNIERWHKGVASSDVFGVPLDVTVQRQHSGRLIPQILVRCADYLVLSGLQTEYLFKLEGDRRILQQMISMFNDDWNAALPEAADPVDVAAVIKCFLFCLPEPLLTFELFHEVRDARSSIDDMRNVLKKLPNANYSTLEYVTALLLRVSQKSSLNKMDARSLAVELAPSIMWQKGDERPDFYGRQDHLKGNIAMRFRTYSSFMHFSKESSNSDNFQSHYGTWDDLSEDDDVASSPVPLDDGWQTDFGVIEVIQCLIEHHNAIFTEVNETDWK